MDVSLSWHAKDQCKVRGIDPREVLATVRGWRREIERSGAWEVRVVVGFYQVKQVCEDGSNGDLVLACVDPRNLKIKTVMLQRSSQAYRKQADGEAPYFGL
jgi:hypothetical protein